MGLSPALHSRLLELLPPRRDGQPRMAVVTGEVVNDFGVYDAHGARIAGNLSRQWANPIYVVSADGDISRFDPEAQELVPVSEPRLLAAQTPRRRPSSLATRLLVA